MSIRLTNILKLNETNLVIDDKYTLLESKFRLVEKLIKSFLKDVSSQMNHFKEFFKSQTVIAETIEEYHSDHLANREIAEYVKINLEIFNGCLPMIMKQIQENVLKTLNSVTKYLETPNKLIQKRKDKLLDYEFAKSNIEKRNEKNLNLRQVL
jgi:hypothetical protein